LTTGSGPTREGGRGCRRSTGGGGVGPASGRPPSLQRSVQAFGEAEALEGRGEPERVVRLLRQACEHPPVGVVGGTRDERRYVADPVVAQGQHVEREREVALDFSIPRVEGER